MLRDPLPEVELVKAVDTDERQMADLRSLVRARAPSDLTTRAFAAATRRSAR